LATTVYTVEEITLQNGETYEFKPLNIKLQRKFMKLWNELESVENEDQGLDQLLDLSQICLEGPAPELAGDRDALEEALDQPTIYKIIEVCAGIKLNDPNLIAAAAQAMAVQAAAGTN
jgi:hypothetical protein